MKINENIAFAKSILSKKGITSESDEWVDFLKIREICGNNHGYVGILTRIRFVDNITDMDEIESIFHILKSSKMDIGKLNKLSYSDILDIFYDELSGDKDKKNYELVFKDKEYSYYKIYTYEGILELGSPSWCLKTKSNWDKYQEVFSEQWVIINNDYTKRIISPNNFYLNQYNNKNLWSRYGVSFKKENDLIQFKMFDDNNNIVEFSTSSYTSFGVICTLLNLTKGIKKSYYESFYGCELYNDIYWHKIINLDKFCERIEYKNDSYLKMDWDEMYMKASTTYSYHLVGLLLNKRFPIGIHLIKNINNVDPCSLVTDKSRKIIEDYAIRNNSNVYCGVKLKKGLLDIEQIKKLKSFIDIVGDYAIFDHNDKTYLMVNVNKDFKDYILPTTCFGGQVNFTYDNILYWYSDKKDIKPLYSKRSELKQYHIDVINYLKNKKKSKIKGFFNF